MHERNPITFALLYRLAYDAALTSVVLRGFVRALFSSYRRRARERGYIRRPRGGAVTFIQRFGNSLNLNVHLHTLMLDGVYERYGEPGMRFWALLRPDDDAVRRVFERVAARVARLMERSGLGRDVDPSDADTLASAQQTLTGLAAGLRPRGAGSPLTAPGRPLSEVSSPTYRR
ncbi:MAG: transposase [Acidobacteria bacterium]|nr:transposase [Acidobacteriota bacterium]